MTAFFAALILGFSISLIKGFNHESRAYQYALSEGRYVDFAAGVAVGALPYLLISWLVLAFII